MGSTFALVFVSLVVLSVGMPTKKIGPTPYVYRPTHLPSPKFSGTVDVDTSQAPQLNNFGQVVKSEQERWFPYVSDYLASPGYEPTSVIHVRFDPQYDGVAYASGIDIVGSVQYYEGHTNDVGSMIHEMTHVIQRYGNCPGWLTEGIADYVRYYHYEPNHAPSKPGAGSHYTNGYGVAAYMLNYVQTHSGNLVYWINKDCRENSYNEEMWTRLTGKSPDTWWNEMMANGH